MDTIKRFESMLLQLPQVNLAVEHQFCNGIYARTMTIPKGVAAVGAVHSEENFFVVRSGHILVQTENGMRQCRTGDMYVSYPGIKRVAYAVEETVITTFHHNPTNETEPEELWDMFTVAEEAILINNEHTLIEVLP